MAIAEKLVFIRHNDYTGKDEYFYRLKYCPICGTKRQRCLRVECEGETIAYWCMYNTAGKPIETQIGTVYIHNEKTVPKKFEEYKKIKTIKTAIITEITEEEKRLRDRVYRKIPELLEKFTGQRLFKEDKNDLLRRGFTEQQIKHGGYFSMPTPKISFKIIEELLKEFTREQLLKVPAFFETKDGLLMMKNKRYDKEQGKFVPIRGYLIPYQTVEGYWEACQYRLTEPVYEEKIEPNGEVKRKKLRYFWWSSDNASSGSPISYYFPLNLKSYYDRENHKIEPLLVTEGKIKLQFACEHFGIEGMAEAGVGNYRRLVKNIEKLMKITGFRYVIYLALDMDKYTNTIQVNGKTRYPILDAEKETVKLLKQIGCPVNIIEWDVEKAKGIDDACLLGLKFNFKAV